MDKFESMVEQYKALLSHLGEDSSHPSGWHCCINSAWKGDDKEGRITVHTYGHTTPSDAMMTAAMRYEGSR